MYDYISSLVQLNSKILNFSYKLIIWFISKKSENRHEEEANDL